ncbi:MAG TPA: hypothetical protein VFS21_39740, partial [Roseiflexaceae bacterium]|nr:hypothetical protein [Roseiflexaceae bacterium]
MNQELTAWRWESHYLHALRILGLASYAGGQALRTTLGAQLAALPAEAQRARLRVLVASTSPMRE